MPNNNRRGPHHLHTQQHTLLTRHPSYRAWSSRTPSMALPSLSVPPATLSPPPETQVLPDPVEIARPAPQHQTRVAVRIRRRESEMTRTPAPDAPHNRGTLSLSKLVLSTVVARAAQQQAPHIPCPAREAPTQTGRTAKTASDRAHLEPSKNHIVMKAMQLRRTSTTTMDPCLS